MAVNPDAHMGAPSPLSADRGPGRIIVPDAGTGADGPDSDVDALPLRCLSARTVTADLWPHPLTAAGRETHPAVVPAGATLAELVDLALPGACTLKQRSGSVHAPIMGSADAQVIASIDGRPVPPAAWAETRLAGGEIVTLRTALGDGGDNLQAARQAYHRRRLSWEMAAEGLSITRGDVVHITHSLIDGGQAGRLRGGTTGRVTLDREVDPGAGNPGAPSGATILLRRPEGAVHQSAVSRPAGVAGPTDTLDLATPMPEPPDEHGASPLDTLWRLYEADAPPVRARITAVEPATDRRIRFAAIDEVDAYYAAATADLSAPLPALTRRPPRVLALTLTETLVRVGAGFAVEIEAAIATAGDWRGAVVRAAVNGEAPRIVARLVDGATEARWLAPPEGSLRVTVTPGTEAAPSGAPFAAEHRIVGSIAPPGEPANFLLDVLGDGTRRLRWTPPADIDLAGVLIRFA